ncbi:MAG: TetR family transcriptional regulator [Solirubrobacteraceae bacterium]|jgi:AcrR family transcriptional regulator
MSRTEPISRARRADAERNRDKILGAARAAFADREAETSMAEISRRAGVGMATLYRNFPGRRELLEALYTDEVDAVCDAAGSLDAETPGAALVAWLHRFFAFITSKHPVGTELLKHSGGNAPVMGESRGRVMAAGRPLLIEAQRTHEVRDDLTLEQVLDMIVAIASIDGEPDYLKPILQATLDGLLTPTKVAEILRERLGPLAERVPTEEAPGPDPPRLIIHNDRARDELGWGPRPAETTIVETAESLRDLGLLEGR